MRWLANTWTAVWPNLAANVIWLALGAPLLLWRVRRHLRGHHGDLKATFRDEIRAALGEPADSEPDRG